MIFYERETAIGLACASLPALVSLYFFFVKENKKAGVGFLLLTALCLRLLIIQLDPYIHDWDERFHALVAKNMMAHPFRPTLIAHPVLDYNVADWANNHVWVHKQPVFLWQMALSMNLFGVSPFAVRLPSAILGVFMIYFVYDIGRKWLKRDDVAYIGAFLATFSYYALELTSGWRSLEHNDLVFTVYMTAAFWAFANYVHHALSLKWALLVGMFAGIAILNKWLVGLLVFGGWGIYLLLAWKEINRKKILHFLVSVLVACIVFLPWQLYILDAFPLESAASYASNRTHMIHDLGHPGSNWYHILFLPTAYHIVLLPFLIIGLGAVFLQKKPDRKLTISFIAMIIVLFTFFSLFVLTRMPAFVFPVSGLIFLLMSLGIISMYQWVSKRPVANTKSAIILCSITLLAGFFSLKPGLIMKFRSIEWVDRNKKLEQFHFFKSLDDKMLEDRVVFNCKAYNNIDLMFYKDAIAYFAYPKESTVDSLQSLGYKLAAFEFPAQHLPDYILQDKEIIIIEKDIW